jgi:hypothetical protein
MKPAAMDRMFDWWIYSLSLAERGVSSWIYIACDHLWTGVTGAFESWLPQKPGHAWTAITAEIRSVLRRSARRPIQSKIAASLSVSARPPRNASEASPIRTTPREMKTFLPRALLNKPSVWLMPKPRSRSATDFLSALPRPTISVRSTSGAAILAGCGNFSVIYSGPAIENEAKMEDSMEHRRVGRSGLKISAIGVGCNPFGIEVDAATAGRIIDRALGPRRYLFRHRGQLFTGRVGADRWAGPGWQARQGGDRYQVRQLHGPGSQ